MTVHNLPSPMCTAALQYARRGWKVFPCRERDEMIVVRKADGPKDELRTAKSPYIGTGWKAATTDEDVIRGWWKRWPNAMIGVPMGDNGLFALDFDPRIDPESGEVFTLEGLKVATEEQIGCALPVSLASRTQSDGVHVLYKQPKGEPIRNRGNLPRHVDVRGMGGYIIAPPSILYPTEGGERRYRWLHGRDDVDPVEAPAALVEILRAKRAPQKDVGGGTPPASSSSPPRPPAAASTLPPASPDDAVRKYALSALDAECRELAATPIGGGRWNGRNNGIYHAALKMGGFVAAGAIGETVVRAALQGVIDNMAHNDDPDGAAATLARGLSAGMSSPRDLTDIAQAARDRADRPRRLSGRPPAPSATEDRQSFRMEGSGAADQGGGGGDDAAEVGDIMWRCVYRPHTDLGNAERFLERYGRDFRWCAALGWSAWDGRRWMELADDATDKNYVPPEVMEAVYKTVRAIQDEAALVAGTGVKKPDIDLDDDDRITPQIRKQWALYIETGSRDDAADYVTNNRSADLWSDVIRKWGRTTEAMGKISAIAKLARPKLAVKVEAFDADPLAINVLNGTLRFRRVIGADGKAKAEYRLFPHRREDLMRKLAPVQFDRAAKCPIYDDLIEWAQSSAPVRRYLHAWAGYSMTADVSEQKLQFWYGRGGNGKSTVIDAWCAAYGDYSDTIGIESFLDQGIKKRGDQASPDLAKLDGCRLLRTSEPEEGGKLAAGLIKLVTGGEPVPVRHLNKGFFNLKVKFKLTVSFNEKPDIRQTDNGIWRRVKLVGWNESVIDEQNPNGSRPKDLKLPDKLLTELDGIFNRLVDGLIDWLENGLIEPDEVTRDTLEYRDDNDPLAKFLRLCTVPDPDACVRSSRLYELFSAWCKVADETEWKQKGFSKAMASKGFKKKASDGMHWLGIRMVREPHEFVDEHGRPKAFSLPDAADVRPSATAPPAPRWGDPDDGMDDPSAILPDGRMAEGSSEG